MSPAAEERRLEQRRKATADFLEDADRRHNAERRFARVEPEVDPEVELYVSKLRAHDWTFEYSDDHRVYCRGRDARDELRAMQKRIDPLGDVWNAHAPEGYGLRVSVQPINESPDL